MKLTVTPTPMIISISDTTKQIRLHYRGMTWIYNGRRWKYLYNTNPEFINLLKSNDPIFKFGNSNYKTYRCDQNELLNTYNFLIKNDSAPEK